MRIGIVCPYSFDVPGGVQNHVMDLAEALIGLGHEVSVLAPADEDAPLPAYVVPAGRAVPLPYNGSVARIAFGPVSTARVRRWLARGGFDVLHVHEPLTLSLSMLAVLSSRGPVVATFHTAMTRSRALSAAQGLLQLVLEKITARIAVSALARRVQVEHLDGGAVEIPNGVAVAKFADAEPLERPAGETIGFLGRFTEPRKGFALLRQAFVTLAPHRPGLRLLVAGPGDPDELFTPVPPELRDRITHLGLVSEADKARMLRSVDVYVAPNTGGESFGMILTEAMAAGAPIVASDLDAFRRVLDGGRAGELFPTGDAEALTRTLAALLDDPDRRRELAACAREAVAAFDWPAVADRVVEVYMTAIEAADGRVFETEWAEPR
ncbi:glycosyltransferase family 4 protein [Spirilliplanes yamanashiensis]|uniref:GDP-mannose-dependent alpha-(1-2)-phosphatidylinositol mannosyltransferase n=1 Tax=Spirilliplanes yamanashiensis TaxID=42233 RepID=A0A8J3YC23_9ACTN|nr:glycosyltransferase family 4 protein [Spirilliplanes yamanashiensis]MDP9818682.1 phosphatidylinositol alpha-mannosyltransferase [Spirilliplanes yamanashiensis]GIJ05139.1 GDP-mannose-dependent alpha-(1-2)-phosphatidylinositol mannosyltransferase [Spirilliplanes yamanashiensis]